MIPQKNRTVNLTETSSSDHYSVDKDDYEEYSFPTWNLSTTDDEENYEIKDPIEPAKPSPNDAE